MPKTCKERRMAKRINYLDGKARKPHKHTPVLKRSLEEASRNSSFNESPSRQYTSMAKICLQCKPVLSRYADMFKGIVHQGSELKRKIAHPTKFDTTHYRDLVSQNEWLRKNMFEPLEIIYIAVNEFVQHLEFQKPGLVGNVTSS